MKPVAPVRKIRMFGPLRCGRETRAGGVDLEVGALERESEGQHDGMRYRFDTEWLPTIRW